MKTILLLVLAVSVFGCNSTSEEVVDSKITAKCKELESYSCRTCAAGVRDEFRFCYFDSTKYPKPQVVRENCLGVHVGNKCKPCESIFAVNFGGALSEVSCENFFQTVEKRNKLCKGCVKTTTALQ